MRQTILWCIGNPLLQDDGAGPALFSLLKERPPEHLRVVNCETTPENYIAPLARTIRDVTEEKSPPLLLIVDAADMGLPGGTVRRMTLDDCVNIAFGTHGIPLPLILAPLLPSIEVIVLGIQPALRGLGETLSPKVAEAVKELARLLPEGRWDDVKSYQENCSPK